LERRLLADVTFRVEGQTVMAHRAILAVRSPILNSLIDPQLTSGKQEVNLPGVSLRIFEDLLGYIYSDRLNLEDRDYKHLIDLYRAAAQLQLQRCMAICESELRSRVNEETVLEILKRVKDIAPLKMFAIHYFINNESVLVQKDIQSLGSEILSDIYRARYSASDAILPVSVPPSTLGQDIGSLLESRLYSDCICKVNQDEFRAHKCILASRSPYFEAAFASSFRESLSNEIFINEFPSSSAFGSLLKFFYTGHMLYLNPMDAVHIISRIGYFGLEEKNVQVSIDESNALYIFETAESPRLREKALAVIIQKFSLISQDPHLFEMKSQDLAYIIHAIGSRFVIQTPQHQVN
jgi:hypothetical protein